jgi:hypothetical protein
MLVFAAAFIKKQHVGTTLIYHTVDSPALGHVSDTIHADFRGIQTSDETILETLPYSTNRHTEAVVPSIIHFVFGMSRDFGGKPFGFPHYLSMYSGEAIEQKSGRYRQADSYFSYESTQTFQSHPLASLSSRKGGAWPMVV